jgi:hypothetical protein
MAGITSWGFFGLGRMVLVGRTADADADADAIVSRQVYMISRNVFIFVSILFHSIPFHYTNSPITEIASSPISNR